MPQDAVQQSVDHPAMAEHRDGVLVVARRHDVADSRVDASEKRLLVNAARQMAACQPRQLLGVLGGDLLDRDVVLEIAVVLGEAVVDLDGAPQRIGNRLRGLHRAPLRAADQSSDREARQRVGKPFGLLDALLGQVGIGPLSWLAAKRQRVPDQ